MAVETASAYTEKSDEQRAITEMVRQFVDEQVIPIAEEYDHEDKFPEAVVEQMKELGLFGVTIPEEDGGVGVRPPTSAGGRGEVGAGPGPRCGHAHPHF